MCYTVPFVELTVSHASVLIILSITCERYYAVCRPLYASRVWTKKRTVTICLFVWVVSFIFTAPMLLITTYYDLTAESTRSTNSSVVDHNNRGNEFRTITELSESTKDYSTADDGMKSINGIDTAPKHICAASITEWQSRAYFICVMILLFFVPLFILTIIYRQIVKRLKPFQPLNEQPLPKTKTLKSKIPVVQQRDILQPTRCSEADRKTTVVRNVERCNTISRKDEGSVVNEDCKDTFRSTSQDQISQTRKQVVYMLIGVIFIFFISLLPIKLLTIVLVAVPSELISQHIDERTYFNILLFSRIMLYFNSAINPIIYNSMSTKFRNAFKHVVFCFRKTNTGPVSSNVATHIDSTRGNRRPTFNSRNTTTTTSSSGL